jgi:virginiamycin B lyase
VAVVVLLSLGAAQAHAALTPMVTNFDVGTQSAPTGVTTGPDNALWFTKNLNNSGLGRIVPGQSPTFPVSLPGERPRGITVGPDNNLWYTEGSGTGVGDKIGRYSPTSDTHTTFGSVALDNHRPEHIVAGPDGALWFDEPNTGPPAVGRITTAGVLTEFALAYPQIGTWGIAVGSDGNLWVSDYFEGKLWRMAKDGTVTGGPFAVGAGPLGLVTGPDGNLWVTEFVASKIGVVSTTGTLLHEYPVAHKPMEIAVGPDGALWFTANDCPPIQCGGGGGAAEVGRITTNGNLFEKPLATDTLLGAISGGPDGNMWFTSEQLGTVSRITVPPAATTGAASNVQSASATLAGTGNDRSQAGTSHFEYGPTTGYGSATADTALPASAADQSASAGLTGLSPSTLYHYRLVVVNGTDMAVGADQTLTTAAATPSPSSTPSSGSSGSGPIPPRVGPPPPPPLIPPPADLRLRARAVDIGHSGRGTLPVACSAAETCVVEGDLTASVPTKWAGRAALKKVGTLRGSIPAARVGAVRIKLNKTGRRLLRRRGHIRVTAAGTVRSATQDTGFRRVLLVKSKPRRHRR